MEIGGDQTYLRLSGSPQGSDDIDKNKVIVTMSPMTVRFSLEAWEVECKTGGDSSKVQVQQDKFSRGQKSSDTK